MADSTSSDRLGADILGMCCVDWTFFIRHAHLPAEIFTLKGHQTIWRKMQEFLAAGNDGTNIMCDLGVALPNLTTMIGSLTDGIPRVFNGDGYIGHLLRDWRRREVSAAGERIKQLAFVTDETEIPGRIITELDRVLLDGHTSNVRRLEDMRKVYDQAQKPEQFLTLGYADLDSLLHPSRRKWLLMCAYSTVGKTAWILNVFQRILKANPTRRAILFELESSEDEIYCRNAQIWHGVPSAHVTTTDITDFHMANSNLRCVFDPCLTFEQMSAEVKRTEVADWRAPVDYIGIDYLGLVDPGTNATNEVDIGYQLAKQCQRFAKKHNALTIVTHNLSGEGSVDKKPSFREIRGHKQVVIGPDYILTGWRPGHGGENDHEFRIWVAKNKNGPQSELIYHWHPRHLRITEQFTL